MKAFTAIAGLTCRSAVRSHVFQFLLVILVAGVFLVPNTVKGDGSAYSYIQVSLEYSLSFITTMLVLSAVWLGCQTMTQDVEDQRLQLIAVKPVSRYTVWFGKFFGVVSILGALLVISSVVVYLFITWQYQRAGLITGKVSAKESKEAALAAQARISNEVLTGRRVYEPSLPDFDALVRKQYAAVMSKRAGEKRLTQLVQAKERQKILDELRKQIVAQFCEVRPQSTNYWQFRGLPDKVTGPLFVRYKCYSGSEAVSKSQSKEYGAWGAVCYFKVPPDPASAKKGEKPEPKVASAYISRPPEEILCVSVNELVLPADQIVHDGQAVIGFTNYGKNKKSVLFQIQDGPKLLIRKTGFADNYARAVLMQFLAILAVAMISMAVASFLSMPTAVFFAVCYLVFGMFSLYLQGAKEMYGDAMPAMDAFGYYFSSVILSSVIPVQKFGVSELVANGELIEWSLIGSNLLFQVILKGVPAALIGAWLYSRRELALAALRR